MKISQTLIAPVDKYFLLKFFFQLDLFNNSGLGITSSPDRMSASLASDIGHLCNISGLKNDNVIRIRALSLPIQSVTIILVLFVSESS